MPVKYSLLIVLIFFQGCDDQVSTPSNVTNKIIHTEIGQLKHLISIPAEPVSVKWELDESMRDAGSLTVLFKFKSIDYENILKDSNLLEKKQNTIISISLYDKWLPEDAKLTIKSKAYAESYELIEVYSYKPDLFIKTELSPFIHGSIMPLNNGYILVSLYSL